jgi:hypothetical protein
MRSRLFLLGGQTVSLGLMMAFLVVPASSLFLVEYGADALPYAYLAVAGTGVLVSAAMTRAQGSWSLARVSATLLVVYVVFVAVAWLLIIGSDAVWVTFPLLVLFPLSIPIGFVVVGTQAGRLLDIRQMKSHFPRIAAGFSVGFALGGLAAAGLVGVLGGPENLLAFDLLAALGFLALVVETSRRFPAQLRSKPEPIPPPVVDDVPIERMRGRHLVVLIFGYQLLSAAVTQLLDFMVWERAAARYPDVSDLAEFLGVFGAIINVVSVAFVVLLAGWLLTRYGLSLGLAANPAGVLVLLVASTVLGLATGIGSLGFFVIVCAQQVVDISFTDGTTRASINATYQALPVRERVAAQTRIEGAGVPLALGFVGVVLIGYEALGLDILALVVFTLALTVGWVLLAVLAYREYGVNLRASLVERAWDPISLRLDDDASRAAVANMVRSDDLRDVRTAVDLLLEARSPILTEQLMALIGSADPDRQGIGVEGAARAGLVELARPLSVLALDEAVSPQVRGLAARVAAGLAPDSADVTTLAEQGIRPVQLAALAAMADAGLSDGQTARAACVAALRSGDPNDVQAALLAITNAAHADFVPPLLDLCERPTAPPELSEALVAHADHLVGPAAAALAPVGSGASPARLRLIEALGAARTPLAQEQLVGNLRHRDREVSRAVLTALHAGGTRLERGSSEVASAVHDEVTRIAEAALTLIELGDQTPEILTRALRDEIAGSQERVVDLLGLLHDGSVLARAVGRLGSAVESERGLALEALEVTLGRAEAAVVLPAVDPTLSDAERLIQLTRGHGYGAVQRSRLGAEERLRQLVQDPDGFWADAWLRACAIYALPQICPEQARPLAEPLVRDPDPIVAETAASVLAGRVSRADPIDG